MRLAGGFGCCGVTGPHRRLGAGHLGDAEGGQEGCLMQLDGSTELRFDLHFCAYFLMQRFLASCFCSTKVRGSPHAMIEAVPR